MKETKGLAFAGLLDGCLVVEDQSIIRIDLEETLRGFGFRNVHGASTSEAAARIAASSEIRFALLDYELGSCTSLQVAEALVAKGIPAVFLTAYGTSVELPPGLAHLQVLAKPFSAELLEDALRKALEGISEGSAGR